MLTDPQFWADYWSYVVAAVVAVATRAWRLIPWLRRVSRFIDDLTGAPARPGRAAQPGVMERLAALEAELKPNGGGSLKDQVTRMDQRLNEISQKLRAVGDNPAN